MRLDGRTAVVTGGAGGIGSAICMDLDAMGAQVVVADLDQAGAVAVADGLESGVPLQVDLADPDGIEDFTAQVEERVGDVDILVSNAGFDRVGPFVDSEPATWDLLIAVNFRAHVQLTHAFLPGMLERQWGRFVYISSDSARVGSSGEAVYAGCKAGLLGFSKTIAREAARAGVSSNVVCPGPTDTPLTQEIAAGNPKLIESLKRAVPMRRLGRPEDIAASVSFLCSERAGYVTGQTISVSGGLTMV